MNKVKENMKKKTMLRSCLQGAHVSSVRLERIIKRFCVQSKHNNKKLRGSEFAGEKPKK